MELRQLECFVCTVELGSFTKAALRLHISQPALSKQIRLLEDRLGVALFDRNGKKVVVNHIGLGVMEHARVILAEYQQIEALCGGLKHAQEATVTLRMMAASEHLGKLLTSFRAVRPDVNVISAQTTLSMDQSDTDILIYASRNLRAYPLDQSVLCEPLALAVPEGHPLYGCGQVTFAQLGEYPLLSLRLGNDMRTMEDHYYALGGISPYREVECDTPATLRSLIAGGFGIALVPTVTWHSVHAAGIRLIPIAGIDCVRYLNVSVPNPQRFNAAVKALFNYLLANLQSLIRQDADGQP